MRDLQIQGERKEQAIIALLTQRNIEEAARAIGIAPNTLMSWMKLPESRAIDADNG